MLRKTLRVRSQQFRFFQIRLVVYLCRGHPVASHIRILPKYTPVIATDNIYLFYSIRSLHVSAPTGRLQVKDNITIGHGFHKYTNDVFLLKMARRDRNM
jgi:hypothetical protein